MCLPFGANCVMKKDRFLLVGAYYDVLLLFGVNYVMKSDMLASASVWWLAGQMYSEGFDPTKWKEIFWGILWLSQDSNLGISQSATSKTSATFSTNFLTKLKLEKTKLKLGGTNYNKTKIWKDKLPFLILFSKVLFKLKFNWGIRGNAMHNLFPEFPQFEETWCKKYQPILWKIRGKKQ